jgi:hypothetical protein
MKDRVAIRLLPTGVPGLDETLGGGLPEFSFNLIVGSPGSDRERRFSPRPSWPKVYAWASEA